ncbi:glucose dehydrogenase [FAD, quinone] [Agrilus planipennis]|uniref:Glucose dehydrogenase [FAD, quinone] n=1 Tax=Agrilus planipennis TaxID=224129 RepID=A0A1W4XS38_AGRPL|nr:glucose dehydrogenase [FAD, quinone] [Agrilus planipennis]
MACNCQGTPMGPTLAEVCGGGAFWVFMSVFEAFLRTQCDIEDPCGRPKETEVVLPAYDFIVIGSGAAGAVVASRLSEVPDWKVLLIEAGWDEPTGTQVPPLYVNYIGSPIDWGYYTEPESEACLNHDNQRCYWPRGKVMGGTTVLHGMMYTRGNRYDYDNWAALGNPGWSYEEVMPYFLKSEDNKQFNEMERGYHGLGGPYTITQFPSHPPFANALIQAGDELGYSPKDLCGRNQTGFMITQTTNMNGVRQSSAHAYIRPVHRRPNLHILYNSTVTRLLIDNDTKSAYGVQYMKNGKFHNVNATKEVVVSGGSVNSPQLLLLSGIGPMDHLHEVGVPLMHHLPGVGENLHNHVAYNMTFYLNEANTRLLDWASAMQYILYRNGALSSTGLTQVTGFIKTKYANQTEDNPDIQYFFHGYSPDCSETGTVGELINNNSRAFLMCPTLIKPKSRGFLRLRSADPMMSPAIYARYFTDPDDVKVLVEGVKFATKFVSTKAMKKYGLRLDMTPVKGCEDLDFGSDAYWVCAAKRNTAPENHQAGTCKMGPSSDPMAVVNHRLQVHGIDRLRVIDMSIMPQVVSGNPAGPTTMIGEKGADMIKQRWMAAERSVVISASQ